MTDDERRLPALVYGVVNDNLILLPETLARAMAADLRAIWSLNTYGEARRFAGQFLEPPGLIDEDEEDPPPDEAPYSPANTSEFTNGDWPSTAATMALDNLPDELDDVGEERDGFPQNPYLYIDPSAESELVRKCEERGFVLMRDDDLIGFLV